MASPIVSDAPKERLRRRFDFAGLWVDAISLTAATETVVAWAKDSGGRRSRYVTVTGAHGIVEAQSDIDIRRAHLEANLVVPDGMPLAWLAKWKGDPACTRVYGPDLMAAVFAADQDGELRHFLYGASADTLEMLQARLRQRFPKCRIVGAISPPFGDALEQAWPVHRKEIEAAAPSILWVGLSTPKQELWMARHRPELRVPVLLGVGAAFDFHAGQKPQAPALLQRWGLEWAFRLASEPRRLWRRYARIVPHFLYLVAKDRLGGSRSPEGPSLST